MHSLASFTVISMSAITTGQTQAVPRTELIRMPSVFDYVKAVHPAQGSIYTAYWSAHNHPMFERDDIRASIDSYVTAEQLVGDEEWHEDADERLMALFARTLPTLPRPFFVLLHVINTHTPYAQDPADTPFTPWERDFTWSGMPRLFNTYRNSIVRQDKLLASGLESLVHSKDFDSTLVVFTSDHGEEFGEHRQIHHGQDLFDEQTHVPGWIAYGKDALTTTQAGQLRSHTDAWTSHLDILPTLLDAYGLLDSYGFEPYLTRLNGHSLLRPLPTTPRALPMTNCTETFPCPFRNWGMLLDDFKLEAQEWDPGWNCWQRQGRLELQIGIDHPVCSRLVAESVKHFALLPNRQPNSGSRK
jgi:arylsulfatase A-like enzyme